MAAYIALICILLPLVSAAVCYISPSGRARRRLGVLFGVLQILVAMVLLGLIYIKRDTTFLTFSYNVSHISFLVRFINVGLLIGVFVKMISTKPRRTAAAVFSALQIVLLFVMEAFVLKKLGGTVAYVDLLATTALATAMILGAVALFVSVTFFTAKPGGHNLHIAHIFLLQVLVNACILSSNLTWMHFFWQSAFLILYVIFRRSAEPADSGKAHFFLNMNLLSGLFFVLGIMLIYKSNVTTLLTDIANKSVPQGAPWYFAYGYTFLMVATAIRAGFLPFMRYYGNTYDAGKRFPVYTLMFMSSLPGIFLMMRLAPVLEATVMGKMISAYTSFVFAATAFALLFEKDPGRRLFYRFIMAGSLAIALTSLGVPALYGLGIVMFVLMVFYILTQRISALISESPGERGKRVASFTRLIALPMFAVGMLAIKWLAVEISAEAYMTSVALALGFVFEAVYDARQIAEEVRLSRLRFTASQLYAGFGRLKGTMYLLTALFVLMNLSFLFLLKWVVLPFVKVVAFKSDTFLGTSWAGAWIVNPDGIVLGGGKIMLLYAILLVAGLILIAILNRHRGMLSEQPRPFLCGAGLPGDKSPEDKPRFIGPADTMTDASSDFHNIIRLPVYFDFAGLLFILAMFGVLVR